MDEQTTNEEESIATKSHKKTGEAKLAPKASTEARRFLRTGQIPFRDFRVRYFWVYYMQRSQPGRLVFINGH